MGPLLELRDVTVRYGGLTAVADVSFDVAPAKVRAIIGPQGAGKTPTGERPARGRGGGDRRRPDRARHRVRPDRLGHDPGAERGAGHRGGNAGGDPAEPRGAGGLPWPLTRFSP